MLTTFVGNALLTSAILCIASLGLSLAYAIFRFPNFANADYVTVGAYGALAGFAAAQSVSQEPVAIVAATLGATVLCSAVAFFAARLVFEPLGKSGSGSSLVLAAFAVGLLVRYLVVLIFGVTEQHTDRELEIARPVLFGIRLTDTELGVLIATAIMVLALHLVLTRTTLGRCLRATAENPQLAAVTGVPVDLVRFMAWGLTAIYCAIAGTALSLLGPVRPETGFDLLLPSLAAVILGGLGSIYGTLLGALLIGIAEALAVQLGAAEWRQVISFALIVLVLLIRPQGLLGRAA